MALLNPESLEGRVYKLVLRGEAARRGLVILPKPSGDPVVDTGPLWSPAPQNLPQQQAHASEADEIFYGGRAGGGKTDLGIGVALTKHKKTTIFRRYYKDLRDIVARTIEIVGNTRGLNQSAGIWRDLPGDRMIEYGAMQLETDKYRFKGRGRDCMVFDEAPDFTESQILFVTGWLRTDDPALRPQVFLCGNPPTTSEGAWIIARYAAWLDKQHPNPAKPGELRWYVRIDDKDIEVESGEPIEHDGEMLYPKSRTFIPASLKDNPYITEDYIRQLQNLPEPLRSQLLYGDFDASSEDDPWQVLPTAWVQAAQRRWRETEKPDLALRAVGNDVARGGKDKSTFAPLYGTWFDELRVYPGVETPDGDSVIDLLLDIAGLDDTVAIDVIGVGSSVYDAGRRRGFKKLIPVNNSGAPSKRATDKTKKYAFANVRAEALWKFREALDPNSGEDICLPPGLELLLDLCTPRYKVVGGKYWIESKDDIKARIHRSPDLGDAVVLAWYGATHVPAPVKVRVVEW
jgi:hypothetical protein